MSRDDRSAAADGRLFLAEARWLAAWRAHHGSSVHSEPPGRLLNQVHIHIHVDMSGELNCIQM